MGRPRRTAVGGLVYHVLNRANGRLQIFEGESDYAAFERVLAEAVERFGMRLLAYCTMPNHWHLAVWPRKDGELSPFVGWLTLTHTQRWHAYRESVGTGHVYQGRFKSFPVEHDGHCLSVCRYIERNALRANLCHNAQEWRWGSLWRRNNPHVIEDVPTLSDWPMDRPGDWLARVNRPQSSAELESLRRCVARGQPYGGETWTRRITSRLGLQSTFQAPGRPKKKPVNGA